MDQITSMYTTSSSRMAEQMLPTSPCSKDSNPRNRQHCSREKPGIDTNEPIQPFFQ